MNHRYEPNSFLISDLLWGLETFCGIGKEKSKNILDCKFQYVSDPKSFFSYKFLLTKGCDPLSDEITQIIHEGETDGFSSAPFVPEEIESNRWICNRLEGELDKVSLKEGHILNCCSWYGILSCEFLRSKFFSEFEISEIDSNLDFLTISARIKKAMGLRSCLESSQEDSFPLDTDYYKKFDIIINAAMERFSNSYEWLQVLPPGKIVVLQEKHFFGADHQINPEENLEFFEKKVKDSVDFLYTGHLQQTQTMYSLVIGKTK